MSRIDHGWWGPIVSESVSWKRRHILTAKFVYISFPCNRFKFCCMCLLALIFFATPRIVHNTVHYIIKVYDESTKFWKTTGVYLFVSQYKTYESKNAWAFFVHYKISSGFITAPTTLTALSQLKNISSSRKQIHLLMLVRN